MIEEQEIIYFMNRHSIESKYDGESVFLWIPFYLIETFVDFIGTDDFIEGGVSVELQSDYICIDIFDFCYEMDFEKVFN